MADPPRHSDCYSASEREWMRWTQELRARAFAPALRKLTQLGVKPDHITALSFVAGLAFAPAYFASPAIALVCLATHVLLDGVDGPLARHQDVASPKGSFADTMSDQIVVTSTTISLMMPSIGIIAVTTGSVYIFLYTVVVAFAMIRNAMQIPYSLLVRPRFIVYGWIVIETCFSVGWINYLLWAANLFLATKMSSGFVKIRSRMDVT